MKNNKFFKTIAVVTIIISVVCISIAFAALNATLTISGTATVSSTNAWKISFTDIKNSSTNAGASVTTAPSATTTPNLTWSAVFSAPMASYTFTATVTNGGTIPAKLESATSYISASGTASPNFDYTVTIDGTTIDNYGGYVLAVGASKDIVVTVIFDKNAQLTSEQLNNLNTEVAIFTLNLPFTQATDSDVNSATASGKIFNA